jgi:calcium-dependent protein kinase
MGCSSGKTRGEDKQSQNAVRNNLTTRKTLVMDNGDLIAKNDNLITNLYEVVKFLGRGGFSSVYLVKHLGSGTTRAIKEFAKNKNSHKLPKEIAIQRSVSHPHITRAFEWFEDKNYYYLVTEYLSGGELLEAVDKLKSFGEVEVAIIMKQLLSSMAYLHSKNIVHRDVKPNNIMLEAKPNDIEISIKIIDFGLSENCEPYGYLKDFAGTPLFMAPEVFKQKYNHKYDVWSCGIVMHILLFGESPFDKYLESDDPNKLEETIVGTKVIDLSRYKDIKISKAAKTFLLKLLEYDDTKRPSAGECLGDPWFEEFTIRKCSSSTDLDLKKNLNKFLAQNLLQQACSAYILYHYESGERTKELKKIFQEMDNNGDGRLTFNELKEGFKRLVNDSFYVANFDKVYEQINSDGGEYVEYDEFLRSMADFDQLLSDSLLKEAFDHFDNDKNGTLEVEDLKHALKISGESKEEKEIIQKILKEVDTNGDGVVSFSEFKALMLKIKE